MTFEAHATSWQVRAEASKALRPLNLDLSHYYSTDVRVTRGRHEDPHEKRMECMRCFLCLLEMYFRAECAGRDVGSSTSLWCHYPRTLDGMTASNSFYIFWLFSLSIWSWSPPLILFFFLFPIYHHHHVSLYVYHTNFCIIALYSLPYHLRWCPRPYLRLPTGSKWQLSPKNQ